MEQHRPRLISKLFSNCSFTDGSCPGSQHGDWMLTVRTYRRLVKIPTWQRSVNSVRSPTIQVNLHFTTKRRSRWMINRSCYYLGAVCHEPLSVFNYFQTTRGVKLAVSYGPVAVCLMYILLPCTYCNQFQSRPIRVCWRLIFFHFFTGDLL